MAVLSALLPSLVVVPSNPSNLEMLQRPLESALYVSIRYTERLAEARVEPSVGSGKRPCITPRRAPSNAAAAPPVH